MYYNGLKMLSHNAIFNFVNTNRNFGKTWTFKYRAVKRALKKGKKTIWIRRFKKEAKECIKTFFKSNDLQKFFSYLKHSLASSIVRKPSISSLLL